jgi:xanthine dehydrogenase iron-sulfur cluster and FAD-binding subunit A
MAGNLCRCTGFDGIIDGALETIRQRTEKQDKE